MDPTPHQRGKLDKRNMTSVPPVEIMSRVGLAAEPTPIGPPRVLIVDDDADILAVLEMIFTDDGFLTVCCDKSEIALAELSANPIQLLITDLRLVGGTGLDLIRQLRALYDGVPGVIVLTAVRPTHVGIEPDQIAQLNARVIAKPFDIEDLLSTARTLTGWPGHPLP